MNFGDFFRHIYLVFASYLGLLGIPLPLPVPPMPEDPALMQVAPADAMLFVEWFGAGEAAENPSNKTERLAAEPEVRAAITKLVSSLRGWLEHQGRRQPNQAQGQAQAQAQALVIFDQLVTLLQRPGCAFVADLRSFAGGMVVQVGDDAKSIAAAITKALDGLIPEGAMFVSCSPAAALGEPVLVVNFMLGLEQEGQWPRRDDG